VEDRLVTPEELALPPADEAETPKLGFTPSSEPAEADIGSGGHGADEAA
jgi:hypothetical protein